MIPVRVCQLSGKENTMRAAVLLCAASITSGAAAAADPSFTREFDIIYHRRDGFALTLEKVTPAKNLNGAAVIFVVSGGWFSNHEFTQPHKTDELPVVMRQNAQELLERGYTLFYVVHGTQPKFTIREIHLQLNAAVRFIRSQAEQYKISPQRIKAATWGHLPDASVA